MYKDFQDVFDYSPFENGVRLRRQLVFSSFGQSPVIKHMTNVPHRVLNISPYGYTWGYKGSGPWDLALNIIENYLLHIGYIGKRVRLNDDFDYGECFELSRQLTPEFVVMFVSKIDQDKGGDISYRAIDGWIQSRLLSNQEKKLNTVSRKKFTKKKGYIYLLKGQYDGKVAWKIGKSSDPHNRLHRFEVKIPFDIELQHLILAADMNEAEKNLHKQLSAKRIKGEWFDLSEEDVIYIKSLHTL